MNIPAAIEHGTTNIWYGRFIDFPGTHARALSRQLLLEELREELDYHLRWLEIHGEPIHVGSYHITIEEEVMNIPNLGKSGGVVALFEFDKQVITEEKMKSLFLLMDYHRKDLLEVTRSIPQENWEYIPPGKERNILDILVHLCNAEEFYLSRLGEKADERFEEHAGMSEDEIDELPVFERLHVVREACKETLRELVPEKKDTVFTRKKYTNHPQEKWTAHKVMRRFLEHEREHYYNILEYLHRSIRTL